MGFTMKKNLTELSKIVSHALRHTPAEYGLKLDKDGWVATKELLTALQEKEDKWQNLYETDLKEMISQSSKKRHEIKDGKIRALYGHSIPEKILKEPQEPPEILYHATSPEAAKIIFMEGLKPLTRHYVHLSLDAKSAMETGYRKSRQPVLLIIRAKQAFQGGISFYLGNENIWLADQISPKYITLN